MSVTNVDEVFSVCHVRRNWADSWEEVSLLEAISVTDVAAPSHATAQFSYDYGSAYWHNKIQSRPADVVYDEVEPPSDLLGYYVRICNVNWCWYGILMERSDAREGESGGVARGVVDYTAYGLSLMLDKMAPIRSAVVTDAREVIGKGLVFNGGLDGRARADRPVVRNKGEDGDGLYFADRIKEDVEFWTAEKAIEYLFEHHAPVDKNDIQLVPWNLVAFDGAGALGYQLDAFPTESKSIWRILNELITRGRGIGFNVIVQNAPAVTENMDGTLAIVEGSNEVPAINVFSFSPIDFLLPGGTTIKANQNQVSFDLSGVQNITKELVVDSLMSEFDQVRVVGAFAGSVCTLKPNDQIFPAWNTTGETLYNEARSGDSDYATLSDEEKKARNDQYRSNEVLHRVYSHWVVDGDWDRKQDYDDPVVQKHVFPLLQADGDLSPTVGVYQWNAGLRIEDYIPMLPGVDYSGNITPADNTAEDEDYLPMQVWFDYLLAEHLDADADSGIEEPRQWTVQTRVLKDWPGLSFRVSGGLQHYIADDLYVANGSYEDTLTSDRALESDQWLATVYIQSQDRIVGLYPADADVVQNDVHRVLEFHRPEAHFDILVPGTIVEVAWSGTPSEPHYVETDGGILRDDRAELDDQARLIWEWVKERRRILQLAYEAAGIAPAVGTMFTTLSAAGENPVTLNSVVTKVSINLKSGSVSLSTQAAEVELLFDVDAAFVDTTAAEPEPEPERRKERLSVVRAGVDVVGPLVARKSETSDNNFNDY